MAVDADGALTVIELKSDPADVSALAQAVRYWDWLTDKRAWFARAYPEIRPETEVRVFIGAPDFDDDIRRLASLLRIDIGLVRILPIRNEDTGEIGLLFESQDLKRASPSPLPFRSTQEIIDYVADPTMKSEFMKVVADLQSLGLEMRPWRVGRGRWLEFLHDGEPIAYLGPRQKHFRAQHFDASADEWVKQYEAHTYDEWRVRSRPYIEAWVGGAAKGT